MKNYDTITKEYAYEYDRISKNLLYIVHGHIGNKPMHLWNLINDLELRKKLKTLNASYRACTKKMSGNGKWNMWDYGDRWERMFKHLVARGYITKIREPEDDVCYYVLDTKRFKEINEE